MLHFHKSLNAGMTCNCKKSRKGFDLLVAVVVHVFFFFFFLSFFFILGFLG